MRKASTAVASVLAAILMLSLGQASAEPRNSGNTYNPNIINSPGSSGVGQTPMSPSNPSVNSSSREYKGITGTPDRSNGVFNDPEPPGGGSGLSTTAK
jgi:hypothetical protein